MVQPELYRYFLHELPVLKSFYLDTAIISLTKNSLHLYNRYEGHETDFKETRKIFENTPDFLSMEKHENVIFLIDITGTITLIRVDVSQPIDDNKLAVFHMTKLIDAEPFSMHLSAGHLFVSYVTGDLAFLPDVRKLIEKQPNFSLQYKIAKKKVRTQLFSSKGTLFVTTKKDTKVFQIKNNQLTPLAFLSRDPAQPDISTRDITALLHVEDLVIFGDKFGHFSLWKMSENGFQDLFCQWYQGLEITTLCCDMPKLISVAFDKQGSGVIYNLKKAEIFSLFVAHSKRINSAEIQEGMMVTASDDCTVKIWRLWGDNDDQN